MIVGFMEADDQGREELISETERQLHLARQFCRFSKMQKVCKNPSMQAMLEKYKKEIIKLMEHQHV